MSIKLKENQYIKAMNGDMTCRGRRFEVGKEYKVEGELSIGKNGFHACKYISNTLCYYDVGSIFTVVTFLGDVEHDEGMKISVTNHIRTDKVLSFEGCVDLDNTGRWCYEWAYHVDGTSSGLLQSAVIEKDVAGKWCYLFACNVSGADVDLLQSKVIEKDTTGEYCYSFARDVDGADVKLLQDAVIEKDGYGEWCYWFLHWVEGSDYRKLKQRLKELNYF